MRMAKQSPGSEIILNVIDEIRAADLYGHLITS